ncbi:MAG: DMT family transporter [Phycisphaerae bacterium]|nr:DMT family transporter [Phycisphaerae bacterium]
MDKAYKSDLLLLLAAFVWGTAFVAQRKGMEFVGPYTYNTIRFAIGGLVLLPLVFRTRAKGAEIPLKKSFWFGGAIAGAVLFGGTSFQQVGLQYTTAGKAGFITGLYVVLIPVISTFMGRRYRKSVWAASVLVIIGLFLLCMGKQFYFSEGDNIISPIVRFWQTSNFNRGDGLVFVGAVIWAVHVLVIERLIGTSEAIYLACCQFMVCALLSFTFALVLEQFILSDIMAAAIPILYGGLLSVGLGFSLQVFAQKNAPAAHVAIIMSFEAVFAVVAGWLILNEDMGVKAIIGCGLMLAGMILVQLRAMKSRQG